MSEEPPIEPANPKLRIVFSIAIPVLVLLGFILLIVFDQEFREYILATAYEGFFSAKEGIEMLEALVVIFAGIIFILFLYTQYVLKIKKIPKERQEKIIQLINDEMGLAVFAVVFLVISILIYAPYQEYKKDKETIAKLEAVNKIPQNKKPQPIEQKPLPEKIIPKSEIVSSTPIQPLITNDSPAQNKQEMDNFEASTDPVENFSEVIAESKAEKEAKEKKEFDENNKKAQIVWAMYLPNYKRAMVVLHDEMTKEAAKSGDGIAQTPDYFQCLPPTLSIAILETNIAQIRFQKNTNIQFIVKLTAANEAFHRSLVIYGGDCSLEMESEFGDFFHSNLSISQKRSAGFTGHPWYRTPDFSDPQKVAFKDAELIIPKTIRNLISAMEYSLTVTNK